ATFIRTPPELTIAWQDNPTGARAWLVINSLRGGAAGGGTRMRLGLDPREVIYLAKAMELKFSICGPPIGGAKNGIDFNPRDPRKREVLERWYHALRPMLRDRYGTGGDLNVDELLDVIPAFERLGLAHPQQGVIQGHLQPDAAQFEAVLAHMDAGVRAPLKPPLDVAGVARTVADMVTGYGVAVSVQRWYQRTGRELRGARVLLEGFGNVGAAAGLYLARFGARIAAIADAERCLVAPQGLGEQEMEALVRRPQQKLLPADDARVHPGHRAFWEVPADVFVAAAISESVLPETLDRLGAAGVQVIAAGSNQPFRELKIGSTRVAQNADGRFTVLPDILANCGMARTFSYLMEPAAEATAAAIYGAVDRTIEATLDETLTRTRGARTGLLAATLGLALDRIGAGE
ncbi:MAG TPA: Glu/Leu/Phe/Val dehydrogenase dimerization domain-containing protein, partial [Longimicrobiales bacterium]|nr:Glu/Leu/Phe/Val dehydrogenase dimerization domain-containing protein [Longimicrobiales bacterium]